MKSLFFAIFLMLSVAQAFPRHDVGNGGDSLVITIRRTASLIESKLATLKPECLSKLKLNAESFKKLLNSTKVQTSEKPLYLGSGKATVFKEAINYPSRQLIIFHRESYRSSDQKEQLIIHEFMGIAGIEDEDYSESSMMTHLINQGACQDLGTSSTPIVSTNELPEGFVPLSTAIDARGVIYMLDSDNRKIYRFDSTSNQTLPSWKLRYPAKKIVYSVALDRLFVASSEGRVTYFKLIEKNAEEKNLVIVPNGIGDLVSIHTHILVIPARGGTWLYYYTYDQNGLLIEEKDWSYPGAHYVTLEETKNVYFFSTFSPSDLHRMEIRSGHMQKSLDSPYHGDYRLGGPIVPSVRLVAIGSGLIFEAQSMKFVGSLPHEFNDAVWENGRLVTGTIKGGGFVLKRWDANWFEDQVREYEGTLVSLLKFKNKTVLLYHGLNNRLKIETSPLASTLPVQRMN
jgi:hypothetical protein